MASAREEEDGIQSWRFPHWSSPAPDGVQRWRVQRQVYVSQKSRSDVIQMMQAWSSLLLEQVAMDVGLDSSFWALLHPLPPEAFRTMVNVLAIIRRQLVVPFIQAWLQHEAAVPVKKQMIDNALWKLRHTRYRPITVARKNARRKNLQGLAPQSTCFFFLKRQRVFDSHETKVGKQL